MRRLLLTLSVALVVLWPAVLPARTGEGIAIGSFVINTTTGDQSVTGLGGQPKAIIFFYGIQNTTDAVTDVSYSGISWTDCTNDMTRVARAGDGSLSNEVGRYTQSDNDIYRVISNTPTVLVEANFVSCDSDGFTWNIGTTDGTAYSRIGYIAFMGSGIQAKAGTFTKPNATGSQATTGVGFQPTLVFFVCGQNDQTSADASGSGGGISLGAMNGSTQWTNAYTNSGTANSSGGYTRTAYAVGCLDSANNSVDDNGSFSAFGSDGWTLQWDNIDSTNEEPMYYLALRGVTSFLGTDNQRTSNGTTALSGFGFSPLALLATSRNQVSSTTFTTEGRMSLSLSNASTQYGIWSGTDHGCGINCASAQATFTNDFMRMYTPAQTGSSSTLNSAMDLQSLDSDGATVNWTTTDATAREYVYAGFTVPPAVSQALLGAALRNAPLMFCCNRPE